MAATKLLVAPQEEVSLQSASVRETERELEAYLGTLPAIPGRRVAAPKLVFADGREIEVPPNIFRALQFVVHHMRRGDSISLVPMSRLLTTNQAAEILNVSRPFLIGLLRAGAIPFTKVGTHHRLQMQDVLEFKERRDRQMLETLNELANEAQEAGDYFEE